MSKIQTANDIANDSLKNLIGSQAMLLAQVGAELTVAKARITDLERELATRPSATVDLVEVH